MNSAHRHTIGISRREVLQVGYSGLLGLGLSALPACASPATPQASRKRKSVILVFLTGGPSHLDMFDMKPDAPAEIRGEFRPIATRLPGLTICEHLPRLAARADKYALVRSLSYRENDHLVATHHVLTGYPQPGRKGLASRNDWPCYSSALSYLRAARRRHPQRRQPADVLDGGGIGTFRDSMPASWGHGTIPCRSRATPTRRTSAWTGCGSIHKSKWTASAIAGRCWHTSMGSVKTWRARPRAAASRISSSRRSPSSPRARWRKPSTWSANP